MYLCAVTAILHVGNIPPAHLNDDFGARLAWNMRVVQRAGWPPSGGAKKLSAHLPIQSRMLLPSASRTRRRQRLLPRAYALTSKASQRQPTETMLHDHSGDSLRRPRLLHSHLCQWARGRACLATHKATLKATLLQHISEIMDRTKRTRKDQRRFHPHAMMLRVSSSCWATRALHANERGDAEIVENMTLRYTCGANREAYNCSRGCVAITCDEASASRGFERCVFYITPPNTTTHTSDVRRPR